MAWHPILWCLGYTDPFPPGWGEFVVSSPIMPSGVKVGDSEEGRGGDRGGTYLFIVAFPRGSVFGDQRARDGWALSS